MADLACEYVITSSGGTLRLNDGDLGHGSLDDLYWVAAIHGPDRGPIRSTVEDQAFGDGGVNHKNWFGPRHPVFEGSLIVQSVPFGSGTCQEILDDMEEFIDTVLNPMIRSPYGTLAFTKRNGTSDTLTIQYEVPADVQPTDGFMLRSFSFGFVEVT